MKPIPWTEWLYLGCAVHPLNWRLYASRTCCGDNKGFELSIGPLRVFGSMPWKATP